MFCCFVKPEAISIIVALTCPPYFPPCAQQLHADTMFGGGNPSGPSNGGGGAGGQVLNGEALGTASVSSGHVNGPVYIVPFPVPTCAPGTLPVLVGTVVWCARSLEAPGYKKD